MSRCDSLGDDPAAVEPVGDRAHVDGGLRMTYKSKKVWSGALLSAIPSLAGLVLIYAVIMPSQNPTLESARITRTVGGVGLILIAVGAILLWGYMSVSYEITPEELVVRFGPIRLPYRLSSIVEAIPTRVPPLRAAWNFATSWDLVYIRFRGPSGRAAGWPLAISPANKTEFLRELTDRVQGLSVRGEGTQEDTTRLEH
jgi:hypothetical protein